MALQIIEIVNGVFVLSAGTLTALIWAFVLIKKIEARFIEKRLERIFHIIAEYLMSIIAIVSGIATLLEQIWGVPLTYLALGLILYALVNAIGIYGGKGFKPLVIVLIMSTIITLALIVVNFTMI